MLLHTLTVAEGAPDLIEDELFGHARGAFTDAKTAKPGLFEETDGGTLFLDEIGDMELTVQSRLLRVLKDGRVRRIGETRDRQVDVRVIAATHRDLEESVRAGRFRPLRAGVHRVGAPAHPLERERRGPAAGRPEDLPAPEDPRARRAAAGDLHGPGGLSLSAARTAAHARGRAPG